VKTSAKYFGLAVGL